MRAADPASSVWVAANAGSGKTHVLTQRVLRLLLSGVAPDSILCLTYTKAAAAVMRDRVATSLGRWAVLDEADARGRADRPLRRAARCRRAPPRAHPLRPRARNAGRSQDPDHPRLLRERAAALSARGGRALRLRGSRGARTRGAAPARPASSVLAGGLNGDPEGGAAVESLFELFSDGQLNEAIGSSLGQARKLRPILRDRAHGQGQPPRSRRRRPHARGDRGRDGGRAADGTGRDRRSARGRSRQDARAQAPRAQPDLSERRATCSMPSSTPIARCPRTSCARKAASSIRPLPILPSARRRACSPADARTAPRRAGRALRTRCSTWLAPSRSATRTTSARAPSSTSTISSQHAVACSRTTSSATGCATSSTPRSPTSSSTSRRTPIPSSGAPSMHWSTSSSPARARSSGRARSLRSATSKQSIYSFQGAEPKIFIESGQRYALRSSRSTCSSTACRSTSAFVPCPASSPPSTASSPAPTSRRRCSRTTSSTRPRAPKQGGTVTLWPPIQEQDPVLDTSEWPLEVNKGFQSAPRQVAEKIAGEIKRWIAERRPLGPRKRRGHR